MRDIGQERPATCKYTTGGAQIKHSALSQIVADVLKQFGGARLQYLRQESLRHQPRYFVPYSGDLDLVAFRHHGHYGAAKAALQLFSLRKRRAQTNGKIVREVLAADGDHSAMRDRSLEQDEQFCGTRADVAHHCA